MMNSERLDALIQKYVQEDITESEAEELSRFLLLEESSDARRRLILALKVDSYLEEAAADMDIESETDQPAPLLRSTDQERNVWSRRFGVLAVVAAVIAVATFAWFRESGASRIGLGVATVIRIEGEGQVNGRRPLSRGDALFAGDLFEMSEGTVEIVFRETGVHAIAAAPLSLRTDSSERVFLERGEVRLHVPPQGIGFVVETPEREITDLGTSFVVTARDSQSQVFVLDGRVAVKDRDGSPERVMTEGEVANFWRNGQQQLLLQKAKKIPELSQLPIEPGTPSLSGMIFGFQPNDLPRQPLMQDVMGQHLAPLIQSGFQKQACMEGLDSGEPLRFSGIAGAYKLLPNRTESARQWWGAPGGSPGIAEGSLRQNLGAIDSGICRQQFTRRDQWKRPVFDGSRYDSAIREVAGVSRQNHPAWPCLNAPGGFASGTWIEMDDEPVRLDVLFGEKHGNLTFGLLLVECEGESYETTFWGQPNWPLFLTEKPGNTQLAELDQLRLHMEENLIGSFSVSQDAIWKAEKTQIKNSQ